MKWLLISALLLVQSPAGADTSPEPQVAILNGKCHTFIFSGTDASASCEGKLINTAYPNGYSSFMFVLKDKAMISFYGLDSKAVGDRATLRIEKLTLNLMMGTPSTGGPATGVCTYTNPYAGPSLIECSALSSGREFKATFVSDGNAPNIM